MGRKATYVLKSARVTSKGQITIPAVVRETMGIQYGDEVLFVKTEKGIYVERWPSNLDPDAAYGTLARPDQPPVDIDKVRTEYRAARAQRHEDENA